MLAFELADLVQRRQAQSDLYLEFLRVPDLSVGLYFLAAGGEDPQEPHAQDEVYFVTSGKAVITVSGKEQAVKKGSIIYVPALAPHHFHSIEEDLYVLVFFAPAESH